MRHFASSLLKIKERLIFCIKLMLLAKFVQ